MSEPRSKEELDELEAQVSAAILQAKEIRRIIRMHILVHGSDEVAVGARIDIAPETTMNEVSVILHLAERRIRQVVPEAETIYLTPDVYLDPDATTPSTSTIVTLSEN